MDSDSLDYIVIGGGSGGIASARRAAHYGARVALVEEHRLGGTCVNVGCVPKKIMWNAAQLADMVRLAPDYGFNLSAELTLDWQSLRTRRDAYIERLNGIYRNNLESSNVRLIEGRARLLGEGRIEVNGTVMRAPHILLATGGRPDVPDLPGAEHGITSDGFFALSAQPRRLAIVGAGYIAVEMAGVLNGLGSEVTLILRNNQFLRRFDSMLRDTLMQQMSAAGVNILPCIHMQAVVKEADGRLTLVTESGVRMEGYDAMLWAIGRSPNSTDLGLAEAGVTINSSGEVVVDEWQNSSAAGIYAVGDLCGPIQLTPVAIAAGRKLADRLFGGQTEARAEYDTVPSVIFSHPPIGTVGMTEEEARQRWGVGVKIYSSRFTNLLYGIATHKGPTVMKMIVVGPEEKIVGLHVIGMGADEMIQGFAVAVRMGASKADFDRTVAIHPTAAEEFVTMR